MWEALVFGKSWVLGAGLCLVLAVAGCTPGGGTPVSPTPSPVRPSLSLPVSPPTPSGTPSASADALYEEAVAVFRAYYAEELKVARSYAPATTPAVFDRYLTGNAALLWDAQVKDQHEMGLRLAPSPDPILTIAPAKTPERSLVGIQVCEDSRAIDIIDAKGRVIGNSNLLHNVWGFVRVEGRLKITYVDGGEVATCPIR